MVLRLGDTSGIAQGIQQAGGALGQALGELNKRMELQKILNPQSNMESQTQPTQKGNNEEFQDNILNIIENYTKETGQSLTPSQLDMLWNAEVKKSFAPAEQAQQYNMQQLAAIEQRNPQLANLIQQNQINKQRESQKYQMAKEQRAFKSNETFFKELNTLRESIPNQEVNLLRIGNVISAGDLTSLRNVAAEMFANRIPSEFISTASANELRSAVKDAFVADLKSLPTGSRLNQFIEKNLLTALESPLKTPENNQIILESQKFDLDKKKKKIEIADNLMNAYERAGREPPSNFSKDVDRYLKPYVDEKLKELTQKIKDITSGNVKSFGSQALDIAKNRIRGKVAPSGHIWMLDPNGDIKSIPKSQVKAAQQAGGKLIK